MALTEKQEKFCRNIISGMTGKDSYITAYDSQCNANTAYVEANRLLAREDIQARLTVLRKPLEEAAKVKALTAKDEQIAFIRERIELCKVKDDEQSLIRWSDQLNKILSLYKDDNSIDTPESQIVNIDTDMLKKLTAAS